VALLGVQGVGVIVDRDAVLVCDLGQSQRVRAVAGGAPAAARGRGGFADLAEAARWYDLWLRTAALPLWATAGVDAASSAFHDRLGADGRPDEPFRRARVQARQVFVYASAAKAGIEGPWAEIARRGLDAYLRGFRRPDGLFVHSTELDGGARDATAYIYEQAFSALAFAALKGAGAGAAGLDAAAAGLLAGLQGYRHAAGGFRELDAHPWQANATMHLLESALAWDALEPGGAWGALADELAGLALCRFIDAEDGFLREFFDAAWRPAAGDDGRWVEPGHQFEWSWLLTRWGRARGREDALAAARRLYEIGKRGVDRVRNVAVDVLWDDLSVREPTARLWPQTERLRAALLFEDEAEALAAADGLFRYLDAPVRGLWRDRLKGDGTWVEEPAPASSFYHIAGAVLPLLESAGLLG
jgi:mannose-6-phosphate isomerase